MKATKNGCDTALRNVDYLLFNHRFDFIYRNFSRSGPVNLFVESIPQNLMNGLSAADFTAVGFAMLMKLLWDNKLAVFYILGFVLTAYLQLPAVAVAVIGTVICVVSAQRDVEFRDILKKPAASSAVEGAKEIEEEDFFA